MAGRPRGNPNLGKQNESVENTVENKVVETKIVEKIKEEKPAQTKQEVTPMWKPDLQRMICIKNISRGKLIYKSKRMVGYTIEWAKKGDTNFIELGEFIDLKNTNRRFVTEPWIRVVEDDEIEILKYANIFQYYKEILGLDNVSDILRLDFESFKKRFDKLPEGYKNSVVEQAADMIKTGELDSIKIKNHIEKTMEIDLNILTKSENKQNNSIDIK